MPRRKPIEERPVDELSGYFAERRCGRCGVLAIDYEVVCALCQQEPVRAWAVVRDGHLVHTYMPGTVRGAQYAVFNGEDVAADAAFSDERVVPVEIRVVPAPPEDRESSAGDSGRCSVAGSARKAGFASGSPALDSPEAGVDDDE